MKENQIVDIDGYVHVINGKVVCFEPEAIDLTDEEELKGLLDFVSYAFTTNAFRPVHGKNTMIMLNRNLLNGRMIVWPDNMECLPDDLLRKARLLVDEYNETGQKTDN